MSQPISAAPQGKKLLDQYRDALRIKHYSCHTEPMIDTRTSSAAASP